MVQSLDDARRRNQAANRVPPHNLQAEQSLLGAMLLSRDAIASAVETCGADDFYKPAHGHIFEAICTLYSQGEPADPLTVADVLSRAGLLDAVGGLPTLSSLQADTPATANAGRYARIVEEHALLRRLIAVAGEIAELGYSVPDDVTATMDRAESLVFDIAERRVTDTLKPLRELLEESLDRLSALFSRDETITGVPTGFADLDERLSGLQPSALLIVGARPAMGKALALDTPVPTPDGWSTMGALQPGDRVFDEQGRPTAVTYVSPVYRDRACYRVEFDDGASLVADAEHQWLAYDQQARAGRPRVVTTATMLQEGLTRQDGRPNWQVPLAAPLIAAPAALPADPYALGRQLGDGATIASTAAVGAGSHGDGRAVGYATRTHIPAEYLRACEQQRLALLQGIVDTGGQVDGRGVVELCLSDRRLSEQVWELVCSLGHKAPRPEPTVIGPPERPEATAWRMAWSPRRRGVFRHRHTAVQVPDAGGPGAAGDSMRRSVRRIVAVPSVPVRCITVDSPNHLYLAGEAMIPTHNTSFALGLAAHAAMAAHVPTLVFSLEMSHAEITSRLLVSEARVDASRIRNGRLHESDWPKISNAIGRLGEAPLFIDDNPNLTVMEVRAKARRMKSKEGGLGLIIIDYLQLMSGRSSAENRQVEVSEISRGLKILARELNVPVVALSQLSRNLENRADKRPILADLRESGCMPAETRLLRADDGRQVTLGELVVTGERPLVWSLDDATLQLVPRRLTNAFASGIKPVFRLALASGRQVTASANHPFRTVTGWVRLDQLRPGDALAVPRLLPQHADAAPPAATGVVRPAQAPRDASTTAVAVGSATADPSGHHDVPGAARRLDSREVAWDAIVGIQPAGAVPTFDATVEGTHNFVAEGIIAHNSLEQDADVVMFLYRDEVYNPDSADRGTAEVIVAKHRNGPTGTTSLAFLDHYTRFADMARV